MDHIEFQKNFRIKYKSCDTVNIYQNYNLEWQSNLIEYNLSANQSMSPNSLWSKQNNRGDLFKLGNPNQNFRTICYPRRPKSKFLSSFVTLSDLSQNFRTHLFTLGDSSQNIRGYYSFTDGMVWNYSLLIEFYVDMVSV